MISYEEIRPVIDRMHAKTATAQDYVVYLRFEMQEAMKVLPPDVPDGKSDRFHAGCCCLRAYESLFQLERLLAKENSQPQLKAEAAIAKAEKGIDTRNGLPLIPDVD